MKEHLVNKLQQLNVCSKTYCSTTILQVNRKSQEVGAQIGQPNLLTPAMVSTILMPGHYIRKVTNPAYLLIIIVVL